LIVEIHDCHVSAHPNNMDGRKIISSK